MNSGIEKITARRVWFVPDFEVWGLLDSGEQDYLAVEQTGSTQAIYYGTATFGQNEQSVDFEHLVDHRGNSLPATIEAARVIPRSKGSRTVFVVGHESSHGFKIARDPASDSPITTDLLIVELGD
ncbi:MAG: hypothetical protein GY867_10670 [bacterium]|nr:hypothetical protein [bacterium]